MSSLFLKRKSPAQRSAGIACSTHAQSFDRCMAEFDVFLPLWCGVGSFAYVWCAMIIYQPFEFFLFFLDPFVKVVLLFDGRKVKKKKTSTRKQEVNPVYNELMIFDVPPDLLHRVLFVISVADARRDSTRSDLIGRVVIGSATTSEPLRHWHQMLISPRKPVAAWHRLRL